MLWENVLSLMRKGNGGEILFSLNGHGILTQALVAIPEETREVFLDFEHVEAGEIVASHITAD